MWHRSGIRAIAFGLSAAALFGLAGCYAEAGAEPAYVEVNAAPVDWQAAPQYSYGGRPVYYVNNHWYARDRGRWVYYRSEPSYLYRQRVHVQEAPRAPNRRHYDAAPRHELARPRRAPPDAVRVR